MTPTQPTAEQLRLARECAAEYYNAKFELADQMRDGVLDDWPAIQCALLAIQATEARMAAAVEAERERMACSKQDGQGERVMEWQPIENRPDAAMGVLLYTPSASHPECKHGEDYAISIGHFDPDCHPEVFSGWFEQGTNHDCFESWRDERDSTPTHWMPLPAPPKASEKQEPSAG